MPGKDKMAYFNLSADCEATQPAVNDAALGRRAAKGLRDILGNEGWHGTFFVIPTDLKAHKKMYQDLQKEGHEVGLHMHPAAQGYAEFLGIYGPDMQREIVGQAADTYAQVMGARPKAFCMGYGSANDHTYPVLVELGFRHGMCSVPGRILPECAAVWAGAPLFMHYAHPYNRVLSGDLDFIEIPNTIDWESRMWGGKHPQDLRVELVDAKNHFYTIEKSLRRQIDDKVPVRLIHCATHNTFEYGNPKDFRRETLLGIITHFKNIARDKGLEPASITLEKAAELYRRRAKRIKTDLQLDRRGYLK